MDDTSEVLDKGQLRHWLALARTPGLGSRGLNELIGQFDDPTCLIEQPRLGSRIRLRDGPLDRAIRAIDWTLIDQDMAWLEAPGRQLLIIGTPGYPDILAAIDDPPPLLFVQGDPTLLSTPQLAMVGSRNPSVNGRQTAQEFANHLAGAGITITSGLALGIDAASHRGALQASGYTLAVTGTGLDRVYPASNRELAHQIAVQGALISEFPPGTPPCPGHFPRRNRIISGLSIGTLVVEAAKKSGSLITARLAGEQGREIFAIPGSIHNPLARGCHQLIRQGAKLVETADDIIEELGSLLGSLAATELNPLESTQQARPDWDAEYQGLLNTLGYDPTPIDLLIARSGLTAEAVSSMLIRLELEGYVAAAAGGCYVRTAKTA